MKKWFIPTFHPQKGPSIADLELIRKTRAAAKEDHRESFFGSGSIPPPTPPPPDPIREAKIDHLKLLPYIPPPDRFKFDKERAQRLRDERDQRLGKRVTGWRAGLVPLEITSEPKAPPPERKQNEPAIGSVNPLRLLRTWPNGEEEVFPPGYEGQWGVNCTKPALSRLKVYQVTAEQRNFDHKPTNEEIAQRMGCQSRGVEEEVRKVESSIELRRIKVQVPPSKPKGGH
jgi:hypothetical protein